MPTINIEDKDMATIKQLLCKYFNIGCPAPTGPTAPTAPTGPTAATGPTTPTAPTGPISSRQLNFGYYGGSATAAGIADFANHCNFLHIGSWGDWVSGQGRTNIIINFVDQMQSASLLGINRVMITADFCLFDPQFKSLPEATARAYLRGFFDNLAGAHVMHMVTAIYTVDEPDVNGMSDSAVTQANALLRSVMAEYPSLIGKPLAVTYGVNGTPGLRSYDWAGFDNYNTPIFTNGEYNNFVSKLSATQRVLLVPGGGDPWRDDPAPFAAKAQSDPRVILILPFIWRADSGHPGISTNGMAPQYKAVGLPIKVANP